MGSADVRNVEEALARLARRLWLWRVAHSLVRAAATGAALVTVLILVDRFVVTLGPWRAWIISTSLVLAATPVVSRLPRIPRLVAARVADETFGAGERFVSVLECIGGTGAMEQLVVRDAARAAALLDLSRVPGPRVSRDGWLAGCAGIVLLATWTLGVSAEPQGQSPDGSPLQAQGGTTTPSAGRINTPGSTAVLSGVGRELREATQVASEHSTMAVPSARPAMVRSPGGSLAGSEAHDASRERTPGERFPTAQSGGRGAHAAVASATGEAGRGVSGAATDGRGVASMATDTRSSRMQTLAGRRTSDLQPSGPPAPASERAGGSDLAAPGDAPPVAFSQTAVPPALRTYVLKYFERIASYGTERDR
jgi:hypothetical protein